MVDVHEGLFCEQCGQDSFIRGVRYHCLSCDADCCAQHAPTHARTHTLIPFRVPMYAPREALDVRDTDLSSLVLSVFTAYADRPCIGQPARGSKEGDLRSPAWEWHSYRDVLALALRYRADLRHVHRDCKFVVASFDAGNCVELVALDVAAALSGDSCRL